MSERRSIDKAQDEPSLMMIAEMRRIEEKIHEVNHDIALAHQRLGHPIQNEEEREQGDAGR